MSRFSRIVCAIDFSADSREAMRLAMELAGSETQVTLVHVYDVPWIGPPDLPIEPTILDAIVRNAEEGVREWRAEAARLGTAHVEALCLRGVAWDAVVSLARTRGADLIVLGTHGRSGLAHAMLGSVAERVVRHAPCSVLVVRTRRT